MQCSSCGFTNPDTAVVCGGCRRSLASAAAASAGNPQSQWTYGMGAPFPPPGGYRPQDAYGAPSPSYPPPLSFGGYATSPARTYQRVGGWLLVFTILLTVVHPLFALASMGMDLSTMSEYGSRFPGLYAVGGLDILLSFAQLGFALLAGISLWTLRPSAVRVAKAYVLANLGFALVGSILPFLAGLPSAANEAMAAEVAQGLFRTVVFVAVWYSYLNRSERVRGTFPGQ